MARPSTQIVPVVLLVLLFTATAAAANQEATAGQPEQSGAAEKVARDTLARFDQGDPGWKVRVESLKRLATAGPGVTPVLAQALTNRSPATREFAAQALVLFPDPRARPALEQALAHSRSGVRVHAIQALSMLGPLPRTPRNEQILTKDPSRFGVRTIMAAALERQDRPDAAALRKALADYDLANLDTARLGQTAPDFTLTDFTGTTYRLSQFRGKQTVVLRFILFDF
jgi:hypothetical protein